MCCYMCYIQLVSKRILDVNIINMMIINIHCWALFQSSNVVYAVETINL